MSAVVDELVAQAKGVPPADLSPLFKHFVKKYGEVEARDIFLALRSTSRSACSNPKHSVRGIAPDCLVTYPACGHGSCDLCITRWELSGANKTHNPVCYVCLQGKMDNNMVSQVARRCLRWSHFHF
jgi:hypothetical protein